MLSAFLKLIGVNYTLNGYCGAIRQLLLALPYLPIRGVVPFEFIQSSAASVCIR